MKTVVVLSDTATLILFAPLDVILVLPTILLKLDEVETAHSNPDAVIPEIEKLKLYVILPSFWSN